MKSKKITIFLCLMMAVAVFVVAVPVNVCAAPTYVWVDDDFDSSTPGWGADHFNKIQDGVDAVDAGGTVYVYTGIYYEQLTITKSLILQGEDKDTTIIDGGGIGDVVNITADWVNVSGFNITNSGSVGVPDFDSGVDIRSNHNNIENCIFHDNNFGIYLRVSDHNTISNTNCYSNQYYGILLYGGCDYNTITDCNVYSNLNGIYLWVGLIYNTVSNNNIYDNMGNGIVVHGWTKSWESYHYFSNNLIFDNSQDGIHLGMNCNNYTISNNLLSNNGNCGLTLISSDNNTISNNSLSDNGNCGLFLSDSNDNNIYHNNIIDNTDQVYDNGANIWDNGEGEGNYWSDYEGEDLNDDGIGDTNLPHQEVDWYPLMDPWGLDEEVEEIIEDVEEMNLPHGVEDSLLNVLEAALHSIDTGNERAAIQQLQAFIRMVEAMRGNKLTEEEANALIAAAQEIIDSLS